MEKTQNPQPFSAEDCPSVFSLRDRLVQHPTAEFPLESAFQELDAETASMMTTRTVEKNHAPAAWARLLFAEVLAATEKPPPTQEEVPDFPCILYNPNPPQQDEGADITDTLKNPDQMLIIQFPHHGRIFTLPDEYVYPPEKRLSRLLRGEKIQGLALLSRVLETQKPNTNFADESQKIIDDAPDLQSKLSATLAAQLIPLLSFQTATFMEEGPLREKVGSILDSAFDKIKSTFPEQPELQRAATADILCSLLCYADILADRARSLTSHLSMSRKHFFNDFLQNIREATSEGSQNKNLADFLAIVEHHAGLEGQQTISDADLNQSIEQMRKLMNTCPKLFKKNAGNNLEERALFEEFMEGVEDALQLVEQSKGKNPEIILPCLVSAQQRLGLLYNWSTTYPQLRKFCRKLFVSSSRDRKAQYPFLNAFGFRTLDIGDLRGEYPQLYESLESDFNQLLQDIQNSDKFKKEYRQKLEELLKHAKSLVVSALPHESSEALENRLRYAVAEFLLDKYAHQDPLVEEIKIQEDVRYSTPLYRITRKGKGSQPLVRNPSTQQVLALYTGNACATKRWVVHVKRQASPMIGDVLSEEQLDRLHSMVSSV